MRITLDTYLRELLEEYPQVKTILMEYGLGRLEEENLLDVVADKLTIKGFFRLMDLDEDDQGRIWLEIQGLIRESED